MPTPNEIGNALEEHVERVTGGKRVKQSGGGKYVKLDAKDAGNYIYSCKATTKPAIRITGDLWREAVVGARGIQGHGSEAIPAIVSGVDGEVLVTMRLEDHIAAVTKEAPPYIEPDKAATRRRSTTRNPANR